jgi:hypothetical protein
VLGLYLELEINLYIQKNNKYGITLSNQWPKIPSKYSLVHTSLSEVAAKNAGILVSAVQVYYVVFASHITNCMHQIYGPISGWDLKFYFHSSVLFGMKDSNQYIFSTLNTSR